MSLSTSQQTVKTAGVTSAVSSGRRPLGHVVMLDYDDVPRTTPHRDARALGGPAVVCRSSRRSWHVYGLAVRSWEVALQAARASEASRVYVEEMAARGEMTLRTFPKLTPDGEVVTPSPEPAIVVGEVEDVEGPVSLPHVVTLRQMAEECGWSTGVEWLDDLAASVHSLGETHGTAMWAYEVSDGW